MRMLGGPDDTAGVGVTNSDDRPVGPVDGAVERIDIVGRGGERDGAAMTGVPAGCRPVMTRLHLDPSAQAPWTSTAAGDDVWGLMADKPFE
ncbi:hypothetical protein [Mycobacterium sp.]|uniref:hypothetical protein n=1 Tax=Mycobacterium sp. TaxID=1785 RepID=UPI003C73387A